MDLQKLDFIELTRITAKTNLYNRGKCFTKGKTYIVEKKIDTPAGLSSCQTVNDLGQPHIIGIWWRHFLILPPNFIY